MNMEIASSSSNPKNYEVFLSFKGEDTRCTFTSHLYEALCRKCIKTYIDEEELKRGDEISSGLMKAIEESKISVIIFSENYASSSWCLNELLHILLCKEQNGQEVIPVFYRIDPSCVRKQQGSFEKAFENLEERFKDKMEKVHKWRDALKKAADLSGFSTQDIRPDSELVKKIVQDISRKLKHMSPNDDSENLVGIDEPIQHIESLLHIGLQDVRIIGLWGMGGIGKTTLASVIYNRLSDQFENCCFLRNIKEEWENGRKKYHLQNTLFSELLEEDKNRNFEFARTPFNYKERLQGKKFLIILDDVNDEEQLECFVGSHDWFGPGSRIILTSRDKQLFEHRVDGIYKVWPLYFNEALQLFHSKAFKSNCAITNYTELSKVVVEYAGGIPLALKVLGSLFRSRNKEKWESLIVELKSSPNNAKIESVLRKSYDELNDKQREIFLDIACFFKGRDRCYVEEMLKGCDFFVDARIDDLVDKSLITINYKNEVCMHNLIQEMGWEIVRQESIKDPGKRSRLWMAQDIYRVFKNNTASETIEGIFLDVSCIKEVDLCRTVFEKTFELRLLKIYNSENIYCGIDSSNNTICRVHLPQGLRSLSDSLRYLHWDEYPLKSLPLSFAPENLVRLIMRSSKVKQLWDGVQNLSNLKIIDLSYSKKLIQMPNLSQAPNLQKMNFKSCTSLFQVPSPGFQKFDKLIYLDISDCGNLPGLPNNFFSRSLIHLDLRGCRNIKSIPEMKEGVAVYLDLSETSISLLPTSFVSFNQLKTLKLEGCQGLKNLVSINICQLTSLRTLNLSGCSSLETMPELPRSLYDLNLSNTSIEQLPSSIETLSQLKYFRLRDCKKLRTLPADVCKLKYLWELDLYGCLKFENFPEILEPIGLLKLVLSKTAIKDLPSSIENLGDLQELRLTFCEKLKFVPSNIYNLKKLRLLDLSSYSELLKRLPPTTRHPINLSAKLCLLDHDMIEIPDQFVGRLSWVNELHLIGTTLDTIPAMSVQKFSGLRYLIIRNWKKLRSLPELPFTLDVLDVQGCTSLEIVPHARRPSNIAQTKGQYCYHIRFFLNCLKLDQNARNNIISDAKHGFLCMALKVLSSPYKFHTPSNACICYPGNEISEWYIYQSMGSSVNIKLSPCSEYWCKSEYLGFSVCIVAAFEEHNFSRLGLQFLVEVLSKTNSGKSFKYRYMFYANSYQIRSGRTMIEKRTIIKSDHVLMWYGQYSFWACKEALEEGIITEVSIHFSSVNGSGQSYDVDPYKIKRCGVRPLYRKEVEERGFSMPDYATDEELEDNEDEDFMNVHDIGDSKEEAVEEYHETKIVKVDSVSVEEKVDEDEDFANAYDVGDSKVEEPHKEKIKLDFATVKGEDEERDKLK